MTKPSKRRVLYTVVCGAGPANAVGQLVQQAQAREWDTYVIATPTAVAFLDVPAVEQQTQHAVRSTYQSRLGTDRHLSHADAIIVAPATYNTINKWATGVSDTYALGILAETTGLRVPTVVLPFVNTALAANPAFDRSIRLLRAAGIEVLVGPDIWEPHPPGTGASRAESFPWQLALDYADQRVPAPPAHG